MTPLEWCLDCPDCAPRGADPAEPCGRVHDCAFCASSRDEVEAEAESLTLPEEGFQSRILFAESLVPEDEQTAELVELWLIAELDAAAEALTDEDEDAVFGELVRLTPTPKTGALPGLQMVHYERLVSWREDLGADFTIEDAEDEDEDGEDWDQIDPALYTDVPFDADEGDLCGPDAPVRMPCSCALCADERAEAQVAELRAEDDEKARIERAKSRFGGGTLSSIEIVTPPRQTGPIEDDGPVGSDRLLS